MSHTTTRLELESAQGPGGVVPVALVSTLASAMLLLGALFSYPFTPHGDGTTLRDVALGAVMTVLGFARVRGPYTAVKSLGVLLLLSLLTLVAPVFQGPGPAGAGEARGFEAVCGGLVLLATLVQLVLVGARRRRER